MIACHDPLGVLETGPVSDTFEALGQLSPAESENKPLTLRPTPITSGAGPACRRAPEELVGGTVHRGVERPGQAPVGPEHDDQRTLPASCENPVVLGLRRRGQFGHNVLHALGIGPGGGNGLLGAHDP